MCGIFGIASYQRGAVESSVLEEMQGVLRHRGPDDRGIFLSSNNGRFGETEVGLGHLRLSIIDLAGGHQPMSNEDDSVWIVYNGEIYNHSELREALERQGHRYKSRSDTETILHLYEEYGEGCVERLRVMFAFAIWDEKNQRLFCARDRLGVKPFYYYLDRGIFVFGSEIKAVLASRRVKPEIEYSVLPEYFTFGYVSTDQTLFKGIKKLMPGHTLIWEKGRLQISQYWDVRFSEAGRYESDEYYVERFRNLFEESVRIRLMSDVPLGVFLSGGLDSSAIAVVMSRLVDKPIKTFSVGFESPYYSEFPYAREVAKHIGADHHEIVVTSKDFLDSLPRLIWHEDEPIKAPPSVALYFVSKLASQHVKVVLTGEGSDELLAGYDRYWATLFNFKYGQYYHSMIPRFLRERVVRQFFTGPQVPLKFRKILGHSFLNHPLTVENLYLENFLSIFSPEMQDMLFSEPVRTRLGEGSPYGASLDYFNTPNRASFLDRMLYHDLKTYLLELLMKQDNMSMATSVESRVPFLDHRLIEFTATLPGHLKLKGRQGKQILRRAFKDLLPESILKRKKMGFPVPIEIWLRKDFNSYAASILLDEETQRRGYFLPSCVERILREHREGVADHSSRIWTLVNFELWNRIFIDQRGVV